RQAHEYWQTLLTKSDMAQHPDATRKGMPRCDCRWKAIRARNTARDSDADRPVVCSHPREQTALGPREALVDDRSEEHTSELQSRENLVCRLLLEKQKQRTSTAPTRRGPGPCPPAPDPAQPLLQLPSKQQQ